MDGIKIDVTGNIARVTERPARITSGTVGLPIEFAFDEQWEGLDKTAVFRGSGTTKIVETLGSETIVPWEVLKKPNTYLQVGVYGTNSDGTVVIATIWANVHGICKGVDPDGDTSTDPTLPVWQRLLNEVGDLTELQTKNTNDLVEAINEVYSMAAAGGIESDPTLTKEGRAADAKATGDAIRNLTAKDVGARPDTWMPTAADVGARPDTWTPTAADVGATPKSHLTDKNNPHDVTKAQVGLGNVDNTSDEDKPVSTAQAEAIDAAKAQAIEAARYAQTSANNAHDAVDQHSANKENPHGVTPAQIGAQVQHWNKVITLSAANWSGNSQSVVVAEIGKDDTIISTPSAQSYELYAQHGIKLTSQSAGMLTYTCEDAPAADISVDITCFGAAGAAGTGGSSGGGSGKDGSDGFVVQDTAPTDTSVMWVDTSDDSNDGFQEAVNMALAQAKASGEFDGKTPVKGKDYFTEADKSEMVSAVIAALPVYAGEVV